MKREVVEGLLSRRAEFLNVLTHRLGDRALAEDLLQDAFARLEYATPLRDDAAANAWFQRVLRNAAIDHARRSAVRARALSTFASELELAEHEPQRDGRTCRCVAEVKDALKVEYRDALERVEVEGSSMREYAAEAGISPNHAGVRVFRARRALREGVERTCGACASDGCQDCSCGRG